MKNIQTYIFVKKLLQKTTFFKEIYISKTTFQKIVKQKINIIFFAKNWMFFGKNWVFWQYLPNIGKNWLFSA